MGGEVIEADADRGDKGVSTPTSGKFELGGWLLGHVVDDVNRVAGGFRDDGPSCIRVHDRLGIELAEGGDFTYRALEVGLAEEVTRAGEDLAAHHLFVGEVVAVDDDVVQDCLLAFGDAQLHVHGIVLDIGLHRGEVEEKVAVVPVELGDVVFVLLAAAVETLLHRNHVVNVALVDGEHGVQLVGGVDGVAGPGDVAEIVLVALVEDQVNSEPARLHIVY